MSPAVCPKLLIIIQKDFDHFTKEETQTVLTANKLFSYLILVYFIGTRSYETHAQQDDISLEFKASKKIIIQRKNVNYFRSTHPVLLGLVCNVAELLLHLELSKKP